MVGPVSGANNSSIHPFKQAAAIPDKAESDVSTPTATTSDAETPSASLEAKLLPQLLLTMREMVGEGSFDYKGLTIEDFCQYALIAIVFESTTSLSKNTQIDPHSLMNFIRTKGWRENKNKSSLIERFKEANLVGKRQRDIIFIGMLLASSRLEDPIENYIDIQEQKGTTCPILENITQNIRNLRLGSSYKNLKKYFETVSNRKGYKVYSDYLKSLLYTAEGILKRVKNPLQNSAISLEALQWLHGVLIQNQALFRSLSIKFNDLAQFQESCLFSYSENVAGRTLVTAKEFTIQYYEAIIEFIDKNELDKIVLNNEEDQFVVDNFENALNGLNIKKRGHENGFECLKLLKTIFQVVGEKLSSKYVEYEQEFNERIKRFPDLSEMVRTKKSFISDLKAGLEQRVRNILKDSFEQRDVIALNNMRMELSQYASQSPDRLRKVFLEQQQLNENKDLSDDQIKEKQSEIDLSMDEIRQERERILEVCSIARTIEIEGKTSFSSFMSHLKSLFEEKSESTQKMSAEEFFNGGQQLRREALQRHLNQQNGRKKSNSDDVAGAIDAHMRDTQSMGSDLSRCYEVCALAAQFVGRLSIKAYKDVSEERLSQEEIDNFLKESSSIVRKKKKVAPRASTSNESETPLSDSDEENEIQPEFAAPKVERQKLFYSQFLQQKQDPQAADQALHYDHLRIANALLPLFPEHQDFLKEHMIESFHLALENALVRVTLEKNPELFVTHNLRLLALKADMPLDQGPYLGTLAFRYPVEFNLKLEGSDLLLDKARTYLAKLDQREIEAEGLNITSHAQREEISSLTERLDALKIRAPETERIHLDRLISSLQLMAATPEQKFYSFHKRNIVTAIQYALEALGQDLNHNAIQTHYLDVLFLPFLSMEHIQKIQEFNFGKRTDYPYQRGSKELTEAYRIASAALENGEGFFPAGMKECSIKELYHDLSALALNGIRLLEEIHREIKLINH